MRIPIAFFVLEKSEAIEVCTNEVFHLSFHDTKMDPCHNTNLVYTIQVRC